MRFYLGSLGLVLKVSSLLRNFLVDEIESPLQSFGLGILFILASALYTLDILGQGSCLSLSSKWSLELALSDFYKSLRRALVHFLPVGQFSSNEDNAPSSFSVFWPYHFEWRLPLCSRFSLLPFLTWADPQPSPVLRIVQEVGTFLVRVTGGSRRGIDSGVLNSSSEEI